MRRVLVCLLLLLPTAAPAATGVRPLLDLRVRQEVLDGVLHFAPDPDADRIRVRTRAGFAARGERLGLEVRLANEHRHVLHPDDVDFDWDELIVDRAAVTVGGADWELTAGRQDVVWPGGFLVAERSPLDGSRALFFDAVRLRAGLPGEKVDLVFARNLQRDHFVLAGDERRPLSDMDETAGMLRVERGEVSWSLVAKGETDPDGVLADLLTLTTDVHGAGRLADGSRWEAEIAGQHLSSKGDSYGIAFAAQAFLRSRFHGGADLEFGGFWYSGADEGILAFRTPWGRWPKWSELYIYTLIGESAPGRTTIAAWENVAAPRLQLYRPLGRGVEGRAGLTWLLAPRPSWESRGLLLQAELQADLPGGLAGHLLWEMLDPGAFHDGRHGLPPLTGTVHFLRWQVAWTL